MNLGRTVASFEDWMCLYTLLYMTHLKRLKRVSPQNGVDSPRTIICTPSEGASTTRIKAGSATR